MTGKNYRILPIVENPRDALSISLMSVKLDEIKEPLRLVGEKRSVEIEGIVFEKREASFFTERENKIYLFEVSYRDLLELINVHLRPDITKLKHILNNNYLN